MLKCSVYFDAHDSQLLNELCIDQFRKIIIACKYFEKIEFDLCVSIDHDSALMQEWVKAKRKRTRTQKYTEFFLLSNFEKELIYEYYMEDICDCVDLYFPVKKLVIEVDGLVHYIEGKPNAITRLKTFLIEESEYTLVRIDVAKLRSGRCAYLREILSHYMDVCDVEKSNVARCWSWPGVGILFSGLISHGFGPPHRFKKYGRALRTSATLVLSRSVPPDPSS